MKEYFNLFLNVLARWGAAIAFSLAPALLDAPIRAFIDVDADILAFVLCFGTAVVALFVLFYKMGNKQKRIDTKKLVIAIILLWIFLLLVGLLIGTSAITMGPTDYLAGKLYKMNYPRDWNYSSPINTQYSLVTLTVLYITVYAPTMLLGKYLGERKHRKEYGRL